MSLPYQDQEATLPTIEKAGSKNEPLPTENTLANNEVVKPVQHQEKSEPIKAQLPSVQQENAPVIIEKLIVGHTPGAYVRNTDENASELTREGNGQKNVPAAQQQEEKVFIENNIRANSYRQNLTLSMPANEQWEKDTQLLQDSIANTDHRHHQSVQNRNSLLMPAVERPFVLPKTNAAGAVFNYQEATSVIKVSIGRIEVKAIASTSKPTRVTGEKIQQPKMSLEDYLKKRNGNEQ